MSNECLIPPFTIHDIGDIQTLSQIYPQNILDLKIPNLWKKTKGKGIVVAVLDTGIQNHRDLTKNLDISKCRSFIPGEGIFDESVGHGLHVAGIVAAQDDIEGVVGVAPEATIVSIKVLNKHGRGAQNSIVDGLKYCLKLCPDVINMSLGGTEPMPDAHEVIKQLTAKGIPIICSAGNNGEEKVLYPAQYDECIAVGSYSDSMLRDKSIFSSWGNTLDIMAPGEKILSTFLNDSYAVMSGTSMAAPTISGIVALIISYYRKQNKNVTVDEIKNILYANCVDVGPNGRDNKNGWGIVNPEKLFGEVSTNSVVKIGFWQRIKNFFK